VEKNFTFQFDSSLGIFFKYYFGPITLEDIGDSWEYVIENHLIPEGTKGFVLDYRNAVMNILPDKHPRIADFYKNNLDLYGNKKIAILTDNPHNVVISILVESKDEGYHSKPFSTMEAAIQWVLS